MEGPPIQPDYAEYPRYYGPGLSGPAPKRVRFEAISDAWDLLKADWGTWVGAGLLLIGVAMALSVPQVIYSFVRRGIPQDPYSPYNMPGDVIAVTILCGCLNQIVVRVLTAGVMNVGLRRLRGESPAFSAIFDFQGRFGRLVAAETLLTVLYLVPVGFGYAARGFFGSGGDPFSALWIMAGGQLVGALIAMIGYTLAVFVPLLILDRGMGVGEAFGTSFRVAGRFFFPILGLLVVVGILAVLGVCACGVGFLFSWPLYFLYQAVLYHDFFRPDTSANSVVSDPNMMNPPSLGTA